MLKRGLYFNCNFDDLYYIYVSDLEVIGNINKGSRLHDAKIGLLKEIKIEYLIKF